MFDLNPLAMKYHLQDLERQIAASRRAKAAFGAPAKRVTQMTWRARFAALLGRLSTQAFAWAARGVALIF